MPRSIRRYKHANCTTKHAGIWILPLLVVLLMASCQTGKKPVRRNVKIVDNKKYGVTTVDTNGSKGGVVAAPVKPAIPPPASNAVNKEKQAVIDKLMPLYKKQIDFNTFAGKAKMHYKGAGQNHDFTANFRIQKDKVIWVMVTAVGGFVSVARAYVTPDSIFVMNYIQKEAYRMPIKDAAKLLPVPADFQTIQNLLIGNALQTNGKPIDATEFGGTMSLAVEDNTASLQMTYNKADNNMRSQQMSTKDGKTKAMIQYGNYSDVNGRNFANSRTMTIDNSGEPYYLDMNFSDAEFDKALEFPFSIPKNYTVK